MQTKHVGSSDAGQIAAPPIVHEVLASPGQPIDSSTRAFFEPRFGHDFSHVRVHTDERAGNSAHAVNALAYTAGRHIVFGAGKYSPTTAPGQRLLAHELAHSVQQGVVPCRLPQRFDDAGNTLERQVDEATNGVVNNFSLPGMSPTISIAPTLQTKLLQRKSEPPPNPEFQDEEPTTTRSSSTSHDTVCLGKYLIETWGQDTCCTRLGFMDNEAVNKKDGTTISSCNKWPLFLALHAKEHGLDGVASCQPSHLGRKAEITVGGKMLTVGCVDTRANDNRVIEIDAEAAQEFFGSKNLREPGHQVCFGEAGSFATCRFETKCNPHPKETACLPVGVTKGGIDSPEKHGWHTE